MPLPSRFSGLLHAAAYPHPVDRVEVIETHISWVLLAGEFAYKIKRPVRLPFLDFTDASHREFLCREEVRLNRRFAPELYLEVVAIAGSGDDARIGGHAHPGVEHAVRMRRFARAEELDRLVAARAIGEDALFEFGSQLATMQARLPAPPHGSPWLERGRTVGAIRRNLLECREEMSAGAPAGELAALESPLEARLAAVGATFDARAASCVREGHGDLHAQNVVRLHGRLVAFDSLEFEPAFRWIDVADEVAFLYADLLTRDASSLAHAFVQGWLEEGGDFGALSVLDVLTAHRALIRAKVEAVEARTGDPSRRTGHEARRDACLRVARERLRSRRPVLVLVCGPSGSGKSWLARRLAASRGAVHLRSDVERKRLAGLAPLARSGSARNEGLYAPERTRATYERLEALATQALGAGFDTLVDATLLGKEARARYLRLAARLGIDAGVLWCTAPVDVLRERVAMRNARGDDASEADAGILEAQLESQQPPGAGEGVPSLVLDTANHAAPVQALAWLASLATVRPAG